MSARGCRLVVLCTLIASCGKREPSAERSDDEHAELGGEIAARVGGNAVPLSVVASVAAAQGVTATEAVRSVVDDEIAASAARVRGLDRSPAVAWRLVSTRARLASDRIYADAKAQGVPSDAEVQAFTAQHWSEVDRPPTVRVVHALVVRPKNAAFMGDARALAGELARAVSSVPSDAFESSAKGLAHDPNLQVIAEKLPAFTETGLVGDGAGAMDATFAKAAFSLSSVGDTSPVIETPFGFHVIRLLEKIPERRMPLEKRRLAFAQDTYLQRAHALLESTLERQRRANEVVVLPAAEQLMATVKLSTEPSASR